MYLGVFGPKEFELILKKHNIIFWDEKAHLRHILVKLENFHIFFHTTRFKAISCKCACITYIISSYLSWKLYNLQGAAAHLGQCFYVNCTFQI